MPIGIMIVMVTSFFYLLRNACVFLFLSVLCNQPPTPNPQTTKRPNDQTTKRPNDQLSTDFPLCTDLPPIIFFSFSCKREWEFVIFNIIDYLCAKLCTMDKIKLLPYGISDFKQVRQEGKYYVDKTMFFQQMEK